MEHKTTSGAISKRLRCIVKLGELSFFLDSSKHFFFQFVQVPFDLISVYLIGKKLILKLSICLLTYPLLPDGLKWVLEIVLLHVKLMNQNGSKKVVLLFNWH